MDLETADEIKRHFNVAAGSPRTEIRAVAEAQIATNERLERLETCIREESSETRAMIRLSFGEPDRRMQSLEADVASLRARLERLEERA